MVNLYDSATGALIGNVSDEDLTFMQNDMEEESRAVQLFLDHTKIESTVRYLGIEADDATAAIGREWAWREQFGVGLSAPLVLAPSRHEHHLGGDSQSETARPAPWPMPSPDPCRLISMGSSLPVTRSFW